MRALLCGIAVVACVGCAVEDDEALLAGDTRSVLAFDPIGVCTTPVTFSDVTFEVPTIPGVQRAEFHQRGGLTYVAGQYLDVSFTLPACPAFAGVSKGGVALPSEDGIDPVDYYQLVSDVPVTGGHRVRVRLWIGNAGDGGRADLQIWARNIYINGARSLDIAWVGVHDISRDSKISLSSAELKSNMATSSFARFGDDGWERNEDGDKTGWHDFDYQGLSVSIDDSIRFHARQRFRVYSTPWACDITATVDGKFRLNRYDTDPATPGPQWDLRVDWIKPSADSPLPFLVTVEDDNFCTLGLPDLISGLLTLLENTAMSAVKDSIAEGIIDGLDCDPVSGISCGQLIKAFEYRPGELVAVLDEAFADLPGVGVSITVRAPYVVSAAPGTTYQAGLPVPPGERVLITQEGLVKGCNSDVGNASTCNGTTPRRFGARGLYNQSHPATWPVPDPFEYGTPAIPQREKALAAHVGLVRTPTQLPAAQRYAGALLARVGTRRYDVSRPCVIEAPPSATIAPILLGRNDRSSGGVAYGSGQPLVTARFTWIPENCPGF
jgi:hypothetical protein